MSLAKRFLKGDAFLYPTGIASRRTQYHYFWCKGIHPIWNIVGNQHGICAKDRKGKEES